MKNCENQEKKRLDVSLEPRYVPFSLLVPWNVMKAKCEGPPGVVPNLEAEVDHLRGRAGGAVEMFCFI